MVSVNLSIFSFPRENIFPRLRKTCAQERTQNNFINIIKGIENVYLDELRVIVRLEIKVSLRKTQIIHYFFRP